MQLSMHTSDPPRVLQSIRSDSLRILPRDAARVLSRQVLLWWWAVTDYTKNHVDS